MSACAAPLPPSLQICFGAIHFCCSVDGLLCKMFNVQSTVTIARFTVYTVHCTVNNCTAQKCTLCKYAVYK